MIATFEYKEVYFHQYCPKCIHKDKKEEEEPCDECLSIPARLYSHQPEHFKGSDKSNGVGRHKRILDHRGLPITDSRGKPITE